MRLLPISLRQTTRSAMGRKADKEEKAPQAADAESEEKKRLRTLAVSKKLLRRSPANSSASLDPSNAIIKLQGRDIVKRGQRKSRYLFSFPGLICPLSAGKIGVLANLATRNPLLYLEFPLGRMKLFGTHVFPKNKYLALQLTKSAKGVMCEDVFESLIVFSEARWIGQEDENPEEYQLEFPKDLVEGKDSDYDFKGGAGATTHEEASGVQKTGKGNLEPHSPDNELESDDYDDFSTVIGKDEKKTIETTPLRQSARTSRKVSYAESASEKDSTDSDTEAIDGNELKINAEPDAKTESPVLINRDYSGVVGPTVSSPETEVIATKEVLSEEAKQSPQKSIRKSPNKKGALVQARLSSLFEKVTDKEKIGRKPSALLLTDLAAVPIREVLSLFNDSGCGHVVEDDVLIITQCNPFKGKLPIESASLDVIISAFQSPDLVNEQWLEEINRVLKPSGKIVIQSSLKSTEHLHQSSLERKLLIAGFVDVASLESKAVLVLDGSHSLTIIGKKASWSVGSSFVIKKATKALPKLMIDDESDLIDEDSLLTEEDLKKPQIPAVSDCEVGSTKKACKNCTCGRAEAEEKVQLGLTAEQINNPQSACGSCGLGDAFRCSGCPYKGLPPFKLGEKVSLTGNFLVADI